jgi:hypothetical protein
MTGQLPPSKFGAGYTYGGKDQPRSNPQPAPPPPYPSPPPPTGYGGGGFQAPPSARSAYGGPTPQQTTPAPSADRYGAGQFTAPAYPAASQPGYGTGGSPATFLSGGKGAPLAAAILSIVGGLWAGVTVVERWDQIKYLFKASKYVSHLPSGSGWYYLVMAATVAEILAIPLLIAGGALLWQRNPIGSKVAIAGNGVVVAANLILAVAINKVASTLTGAVNNVDNVLKHVGGFAERHGIDTSRTNHFLDDLAGQITGKISSVSTNFIVLHLVLPSLLAIVALVLVRSAATKLWLNPNTGGPTGY